MERSGGTNIVRFLERTDLTTPAVLVIGTLDTKAEELEFVSHAIAAAGASPILLDSSASAGQATSSHPLIRRDDVVSAGGSTMDEVSSLPRGEAIALMQSCVAVVTEALVSSGRVHGAICVGGAGAHIVGPAFQLLPVGFPKLVVSPLASGNRTFESFVGLRDVAVMHSVADIAGINEITERVYRSAAGFIVGAASMYASSNGGRERDSGNARPTVAISMNGNTTKAMDRGRARLESAGFDAVVFHANGVGGRALEEFVSSGRAVAVLDYTTTELGARVVGGLMDAGAERMETAGRMGLPQVLVPGCVDFITCGPWDETEQQFPGRVMFRHNPELTLVRLDAGEMAQLGTIFARKANQATGPTSVLVPTEGLSVCDAPDGPFWNPEADKAFLDALQGELAGPVILKTVSAHVNDEAFADAAIDELLELISGHGGDVQELASPVRAPAGNSGGERLSA